jgi:hypothetical protein
MIADRWIPPVLDIAGEPATDEPTSRSAAAFTTSSRVAAEVFQTGG